MRHVLCAVAEEAGRESGLIRRERKLTGATFVQSVVFGWMANPDATAEERAQAAATRGVSISAHGLGKRLDDERASECLSRVLAAAVREAVAAASPVAIPVLGRFSGVYLYDGSVVALPEALAEAWPGCGGPRGATAALKVGARLDLLRGELHVPALGAGRERDRTLEPGAESMPAGALRLADLGFFDLKLLGRLGGRGCYWLSRLMARTTLREHPSGERLGLAERLHALKEDTLELRVEVGAEARLPARLLAARVPEAAASERRRRLHAEARKRRQPVSEERLRLAEWAILITNAPSDMLSVEEAPVVMRSRWQIEKLFDLWRSHGRLDKSRSKKPWRILCEIYAKLIGLIVQHWLIVAGSWSRPERSLVKAARAVRRRALSMAEALESPRRLSRTVEGVARCLGAGCRVDKRRKEPGTAQQLLALTDARKEAAVA
jgi:hypothetical protein